MMNVPGTVLGAGSRELVLLRAVPDSTISSPHGKASVWCVRCKTTRPQLKEKRRFSRRLLAACVGLVFLMVAIIAVVAQFSAGSAAITGIAGLGALALLYGLAAALHCEKSTDLFAEFLCPECDDRLLYGRPSTDDEAIARLRQHLEAAKKAQREAEEKAQRLEKQFGEKATVNEPLSCRQCKNLVPKAASFCGRCGHRVGEPF